MFSSGAISHVRFQARLGSLGLLVDPPGLLYNSDPLRPTFSDHFGGVERSAVSLIDPLGDPRAPLRCFIVVVPFHSSIHRLASLVTV